MADTAGLLKTRGEWTDAVTNGETKLSHRDWYDQKYGSKSAKSSDQIEDEARKQIRSGYDKVASKRRELMGKVA